MALLAKEPTLVKKAYDIAMEIVGDVSVDDISDDVYCALNSLDVFELYDSSGRTRDGYVDPNDRAWEMFEEALYPFTHDMTLNQKRALPSIAKMYCIGIIKALLRYKEGNSSELSDWVPDAPDESIINVVEEWKRGNPSDDDIAEVMEIVEESSYAEQYLK
ncbi:MAG: hypothetical protein LBV40_02105 [Methanomicrobiales archaeon]|nr:hypothetical protein [Methanomicrobiales archaeon]